MTSLLLIDNYDSFVFNIAQYLGEMGASVTVERNDSPNLGHLLGKADGYIISPGPGHPRETNRSLDVITNSGYGRPILGVCLGHQAIAHVQGASVVRARQVVHGKVTKITHVENELFENVPETFRATRYHSLVVSREGLPENVEVLAESEEHEIMALKVRGSRIYGVQFHPESVMTSHGRTILSNFLRMCTQ